MAQVNASGQGKKSAKTVITLAVVGVLGLSVVYWQFIYSPLEEEVQKKRATHKKLDKENRDLKEEAKIQTAMLECKPELDALNRQNELMLPSESETVAFMKVLTNLAATAGLAQGPTKKLAEATVTAPAPPAPPKEAKKDKDKKKGKGGGKADKEAEKAEAEKAAAEAKDLPCWERVPGLKTDQAGKASFVRVPYEIEVRGTFHQLTKYFWLLHEHAKTGRIITVESLNLKEPKATADGMVVTATFTAVGFREADRPAGEAGGSSGGGAAAKDIMGTKAAVQNANAAREGQADVAGEGGAASSSTPPAATPAPGAAPANPAKSGAERLSNPGVSP